ncbi:MAG: hypothetical protein FWC15_02135 [Fibromonadales bacterium]|nr:hypothetical protein [Fibromonadales bacterium]
MKSKLLDFLNARVKKTWWYKLNYDYAIKMKDWNMFNLDLVNLGSSSAKFAFDYSACDLKASNWANQPQNLSSDFAVIKNYSRFMRQNGIVIITLICPFCGLVIDYQKKFYDKYHYFLPPDSIKYFSEQTLEKVQKMVEYPLLGATKTSIEAMVLCKDKPKYQSAKIDAQNRINGWKKQFSIEDLADQLSDENLKAIEFNTNLLCEMVNFCKECSLKPVLGIMPATKALKDHIPLNFMQRTFYDMVEKVNERTGVRILDFYRSAEFESEDLYLDSFLMNEKGRKLFTQKVLGEVADYLSAR